jgi:hypothetical protein
VVAERRWLLLVVVLIGALLIGLVGMMVIRDVFRGGSVSRDALRQVSGARDDVEALIAVVDNPAQTPQDRTRAVWALGQIGDHRALPVLEKYHTGEPCDHERAICQYELDKAIRKIRGEYYWSLQIPNATR